MREKLLLYVSLSTLTLITKGFWLVFLVMSVSVLDICFGVYLVFRLKQGFCWVRFIEGWLKLLVYIAVISISMLLSEQIFNGKLFEIEHLVPKVITIVFMLMELESFDRKRQKLGKKPFLEWLRSIIKIAKEVYKSLKSFKNYD